MKEKTREEEEIRDERRDQMKKRRSEMKDGRQEKIREKT